MDRETEYLNLVIRGKIKFRKCPNCDSEGIEIQAYDDNGLPCGSEKPDARREFCEDCNGLGFIQLP